MLTRQHILTNSGQKDGTKIGIIYLLRTYKKKRYFNVYKTSDQWTTDTEVGRKSNTLLSYSYRGSKEK